MNPIIPVAVQCFDLHNHVVNGHSPSFFPSEVSQHLFCLTDIQMEEVISCRPLKKVPHQIPVLRFLPTLNTPNQYSVVSVNPLQFAYQPCGSGATGRQL